jgi:hypothetical protein
MTTGCMVADMLRTAGSSYALLALGFALGWATAALCYASRRSEDAQRAAAGMDR